MKSPESKFLLNRNHFFKSQDRLDGLAFDCLESEVLFGMPLALPDGGQAILELENIQNQKSQAFKTK